MHVDNWKYFDADDYVIVVNTFQEEESESQQNVYVALKKDIEKNVSVHDVMVECLEMK